MTRKTWIYTIVIAAVFVVVLAGTVAIRFGLGLRDVTADYGPPGQIPTATLGGETPGSLVSALTIPGLTPAVPQNEVKAARVLYRSTEGDSGASTEVSGTVFVPTTPPPPGGWPVLAYAHGSTGINTPCAPSLSSDLVGQGPLISAWVRSGYAVTFPDYQGLGAPGVHPYLDARTAGLNLIDSVRALRATFPGVSERWAGYGPSQGGGAVWAANEQALTYAPELKLVGTSAVAPSTTPSGLLDKAQDGTLTPAQGAVFAWLLTAVGRLHPEVDLDRFRRGEAAAHWDDISACSTKPGSQNGALSRLKSQDLTPDDPEAEQQLRAILQPWDLPQRPLSAPLSVVFGGADPFIDVGWVQNAIQAACATGGEVVWRLEEDKGHEDLNTSDQVRWLADRFAGRPLANYCR